MSQSFSKHCCRYQSSCQLNMRSKPMVDHWSEDHRLMLVQRVKVSFSFEWQDASLNFNLRRKKSCAEPIVRKWKIIVHAIVEQQWKWSVWFWRQIKAEVEVRTKFKNNISTSFSLAFFIPNHFNIIIHNLFWFPCSLFTFNRNLKHFIDTNERMHDEGNRKLKKEFYVQPQIFNLHENLSNLHTLSFG